MSTAADGHRACVVLDWDGTVTVKDTLHMVIERFGDLDTFTRLESDLDGRRLTLNEVIERQMATVKAPLAEVVEWLRENVEVRSGLARLVAEYDARVVSAGFLELIEPILEREGVKLPVSANTLDPDPLGWRALFSPRPICSVCGERCKRGAVEELSGFVYVGDGISDRCVSLCAERVFARAGLSSWLAARDVAHEAFDDFDQVRECLAAGAPRSGLMGR